MTRAKLPKSTLVKEAIIPQSATTFVNVTRNMITSHMMSQTTLRKMRTFLSARFSQEMNSPVVAGIHDSSNQ